MLSPCFYASLTCYTLMHMDTLLSTLSLYGLPLLALCLISLALYTIYLHRKITHFTQGATAQSLEDTILACIDSVKAIEDRNELISSHALSLEERLKDSLRNAQTLRFKALDTNASNQSFSVALLNEKGNGVVITTLHVRDRVSTFAKPITNYASTYELTDEEREVIDTSRKEHKGTK